LRQQPSPVRNRSPPGHAFERFKQLKRAMHGCEGWRLNADLRRLSRSNRVFMGNDDELIGFLEEYEEVPRPA
jgi:hypothetical protein